MPQSSAPPAATAEPAPAQGVSPAQSPAPSAPASAGQPTQQAAPQELSPAPQQAASPPAVVSAEQIAPVELTGLLGHAVLGNQNAELGRIVDLLVDTKGHVRAVVLDVGGFMGVGSRKVAVAWSVLRFTPGDKGPVIATEIPTDRIRSWAEYIVGRPVAILGTTPSGQ